MAKEASEKPAGLSQEENATWMLIRVGKCCGKECKHCPYVSDDGEPHQAGSTMLSSQGWELLEKANANTP